MSRIRLICPNCGAQYEVPREVIPETGRDVQCSSCQHTWFQAHPDAPIEAAQPAEPMRASAPRATAAPVPAQRDDDHPPAQQDDDHPPAQRDDDHPPAQRDDDSDDGWTDSDDDLDDTAEDEDENDTAWQDAPAAPPAAATPRRSLAPDVADVLREEREFEARRRAAEAGPLETQPDLGLEPPETDTQERRLRQAQARKDALRAPVADADVATAGAGVASPASRRDRLPDVEEINQTLRSSDTPRAVDMASRRTLDDLEDSEDEARRGGFARGFFLMVALAAIGVAVYAKAPQIAQAVPAASDPLNSYVTTVDKGRIWLDSQVSQLLQMLDGMSSEAPAETG